MADSDQQRACEGELSMQEAGDMLNVARPYFRQLLFAMERHCCRSKFFDEAEHRRQAI